MHANVLSFNEAEDRYPVTYIPWKSFMVHLPDHDIVFEDRGKMYIAEWEDIQSANTTMVYTNPYEL
jgi:hypothetical protein